MLIFYKYFYCLQYCELMKWRAALGNKASNRFLFFSIFFYFQIFSKPYKKLVYSVEVNAKMNV